MLTKACWSSKYLRQPRGTGEAVVALRLESLKLRWSSRCHILRDAMETEQYLKPLLRKLSLHGRKAGQSSPAPALNE